MTDARCAKCGKAVRIELLDAKPGPGDWSYDDLSDAAETGKQFTRLECRECYGPNYVPGGILR